MAERPPRHVALLRGINVGRAKRVAMSDLRALVADLGYADVVTLLNSGNVVFTASTKRAASAAGGRIERAMVDRLGVSARVIVLSAADVAEIMAKNPLASVAHDPARMLVTVWRTPDDRARLTGLTRQAWTPEALVLGRAQHTLVPRRSPRQSGRDGRWESARRRRHVPQLDDDGQAEHARQRTAVNDRRFFCAQSTRAARRGADRVAESLCVAVHRRRPRTPTLTGRSGVLAAARAGDQSSAGARAARVVQSRVPLAIDREHTTCRC